jgi:hypothetical protein
MRKEFKMWTIKEVLKDSFEWYLTSKTIGRLEGLRELINKPEFQRAFEGGFHFEEEAKYLSDETIARFQAVKEFCSKPEFQKMLGEDRLKDDKVIKDLRENTILKDFLDDLPRFHRLVKPGLKYDPEVQSIMSQIEKEFAEVERIGIVEWRDRIEEEKNKKYISTKPIEPIKENPKKWLPFYFNSYLKHLSMDRLVDVKQYLDRPGVQVELNGELKDDEELQSIVSQINKLWDDYQKDEEERKRKLRECWDEQVRLEKERRQMEQQEEEEERRSRAYESKIPIFD